MAGCQGISFDELGVQFGYKGSAPILRVLNGGRPDVKFILALKKLEVAYEREITEFIKINRPFTRYRNRRLENGGPIVNRPADLSALGSVETLRPPSEFAIRAEQKRARKKAAGLAKRRARDAKNRKAAVRRSQTIRRRLWKLAEGDQK